MKKCVRRDQETAESFEDTSERKYIGEICYD